MVKTNPDSSCVWTSISVESTPQIEKRLILYCGLDWYLNCVCLFFWKWSCGSEASFQMSLMPVGEEEEGTVTNLSLYFVVFMLFVHYFISIEWVGSDVGESIQTALRFGHHHKLAGDSDFLYFISTTLKDALWKSDSLKRGEVSPWCLPHHCLLLHVCSSGDRCPIKIWLCNSACLHPFPHVWNEGGGCNIVFIVSTWKKYWFNTK